MDNNQKREGKLNMSKFILTLAFAAGIVCILYQTHIFRRESDKLENQIAIIYLEQLILLVFFLSIAFTLLLVIYIIEYIHRITPNVYKESDLDDSFSETGERSSTLRPSDQASSTVSVSKTISTQHESPPSASQAIDQSSNLGAIRKRKHVQFGLINEYSPEEVQVLAKMDATDASEEHIKSEMCDLQHDNNPPLTRNSTTRPLYVQGIRSGKHNEENENATNEKRRPQKINLKYSKKRQRVDQSPKDSHQEDYHCLPPNNSPVNEADKFEMACGGPMNEGFRKETSNNSLKVINLDLFETSPTKSDVSESPGRCNCSRPVSARDEEENIFDIEIHSKCSVETELLPSCKRPYLQTSYRRTIPGPDSAPILEPTYGTENDQNNVQYNNEALDSLVRVQPGRDTSTDRFELLCTSVGTKKDVKDISLSVENDDNNHEHNDNVTMPCDKCLNSSEFCPTCCPQLINLLINSLRDMLNNVAEFNEKVEFSRKDYLKYKKLLEIFPQYKGNETSTGRAENTNEGVPRTSNFVRHRHSENLTFEGAAPLLSADISVEEDNQVHTIQDEILNKKNDLSVLSSEENRSQNSQLAEVYFKGEQEKMSNSNEQSHPDISTSEYQRRILFEFIDNSVQNSWRGTERYKIVEQDNQIHATQDENPDDNKNDEPENSQCLKSELEEEQEEMKQGSDTNKEQKEIVAQEHTFDKENIKSSENVSSADNARPHPLSNHSPARFPKVSTAESEGIIEEIGQDSVQASENATLKDLPLLLVACVKQKDQIQNIQNTNLGNKSCVFKTTEALRTFLERNEEDEMNQTNYSNNKKECIKASSDISSANTEQSWVVRSPFGPFNEKANLVSSTTFHDNINQNQQSNSDNAQPITSKEEDGKILFPVLNTPSKKQKDLLLQEDKITQEKIDSKLTEVAPPGINKGVEEDKSHKPKQNVEYTEGRPQDNHDEQHTLVEESQVSTSRKDNDDSLEVIADCNESKEEAMAKTDNEDVNKSGSIGTSPQKPAWYRQKGSKKKKGNKK